MLMTIQGNDPVSFDDDSVENQQDNDEEEQGNFEAETYRRLKQICAMYDTVLLKHQ